MLMTTVARARMAQRCAPSGLWLLDSSLRWYTPRNFELFEAPAAS